MMLEEFKSITSNEELTTVVQSTLPPQLKDPRRFIIPCSFGTKFSGKVICDLGESINLMSLSIYRRLVLGEVKATIVKLQLTDRSYIFVRGEVENILVKVDKFIFLIDFLVLDTEEDKDVPIIMGRPLLVIGRTYIDGVVGELIMRVNVEQVVFNIFQAMKCPEETNNCFGVSVIQGAIA